MRNELRRLAVKGSLRADGPRGTFHVRGDGQGMEISAPSLRAAWSAGRSASVLGIGRVLDGTDLGLRIVVRGHTVAEQVGRRDPALRLSWTGLLAACMPFFRGGGA